MLLTVFFSALLFFSSNFYYLRDRTERDDAGTAMRDGTDGRRAGGGGRRREEGGLAGNMGKAETEGQVTKECKWEFRVTVQTPGSLALTKMASRQPQVVRRRSLYQYLNLFKGNFRLLGAIFS